MLDSRRNDILVLVAIVLPSRFYFVQARKMIVVHQRHSFRRPVAVFFRDRLFVGVRRRVQLAPLVERVHQPGHVRLSVIRLQ